VTSVGLALPSILTVSGSPVTGSGTLTGTLAQQSANTVFAGPASGLATPPAFRALVVADLPGSIPNVNLANSSVTISGHALSLGGSLALAAADVGLGSVTNAAQTLASVVPNTAPAAGKVLVGNAGGTAYAAQAISGDGTLSSAGALTISKTGGVAFAASATTDTTDASNIASGTLAGPRMAVFIASGASHAAGAVPDPGITAGTTRYLREDATWATPAGGGGSPGGSSGQLQYNNAGAFGGASNLTVGSSGELVQAAQAAPASPANGSSWHDSTQQAMGYRQTGLTIFRPGVIYLQNADASVGTPSGASLISTAGATGGVSLPAGFLNVANRTLRIRARGYITTGSASGATQFAVLLGTSVIATCPNITAGTSKTNYAWALDCDIATKAAGASGKLDSGGFALIPQNAAMSPMANGTASGTIAPQTQVTLDLTAAYTLDFQVTSTGTGNSVTLTNLTVEVEG
jgi:hypothetical protein